MNIPIIIVSLERISLRVKKILNEISLEDESQKSIINKKENFVELR